MRNTFKAPFRGKFTQLGCTGFFRAIKKNLRRRPQQQKSSSSLYFKIGKTSLSSFRLIREIRLKQTQREKIVASLLFLSLLKHKIIFIICHLWR